MARDVSFEIIPKKASANQVVAEALLVYYLFIL